MEVVRCLKVQCQQCKKLKTKQFVISDTGKRQYLDENGKHWHGKSCPQCDHHHFYEKYNKHRRPETTNVVPISNKVRLCKECSKPLPDSRYFRHESCDLDVEVSNEYDELVYCA